MQYKGSDLPTAEKPSAWSYINTYVDPLLLFFLLLFPIDKVVLKPLVLLLCLGWSRKRFNWRDIKAAPPFYLLILLPAFINFLFFNSDFSAAHFVSFTIGTLYWLMCVLAFALLHSRLKNGPDQRTNNTISFVFWVNFAVSMAGLIYTMVLSGSIDPYRSADLRFGNSTGDYIRGIFLAPSYINMFINAMFCIYFLYGRKYLMAFMALLVACATSSNFANLVFIPVLIATLFIVEDGKARKTVALGLLFYILFYTVVSPGNLSYLRSSVDARRRDSVEANLVGKFYQGDSKLMHFCKVISVVETWQYTTASHKNALIGAGMGGFSSQLALRTSGLETGSGSRLFKKLPQYSSPAFRDNHYKIFEAIYQLPPEYHSIRHFPGSTLNQLLGEYGLVGILIFAIFYLWFFLKHFKRLRYTVILLVMVCGFLMFDYLFEYLSVMVFFELFFLLDRQREKAIAAS
ncbi:MAG: hypothetical protein JSS82_01230 [Bacteroidetes bacterium]|nr:hypothetical protein [Bacteroidota bacterium]